MRPAWRLLSVSAGLALLVGCGTRRTYPMMDFHAESNGGPLQWSGAVLADDGTLIASAENDSSALFQRAGVGRTGDAQQIFGLTDPSAHCQDLARTGARRRCREKNYRAQAALDRRPIEWLAGPQPQKIQDLAVMQQGDSLRVLGVTEFSSIARVTDYRADVLPLTRNESERFFVLEQTPSGWREVEDHAVRRMQQHLSDWGRASCGKDFVVEGLAYDAVEQQVFIGVNRCEGAVQRVVSYDLSASRAGLPAPMEVVADGIVDRDGRSIAGPSEGLSSLDWQHGQLWGTSSWNDFGDPTEIAWGGRRLVVEDGRFRTVGDRVFADRTDALALLPSEQPSTGALVLFDNDRDQSRRPTGTIVAGHTPAPEQGYIGLLSFGPSPLGAEPLGLNGFDMHWFQRDHRLGELSFVVDRNEDAVGGWSSALGGLWQVRLGELADTLGFLGTQIGENRQAIEVTDYSPIDELTFTSYQAVLSVVPRELGGEDVSVGMLLDELFEAGSLEVTLPEALPEGSGVVLQGFRMDSSPRADGGICVAAMDVDVGLTAPDRVALRAGLIGGLCNDFNTQGVDEYHGLTTDPDAGVRVTLYFATVSGADAQRTGVVVAQRDRPGDRVEPTHVVSYAPSGLPPTAEYRRPPTPDTSNDSPNHIGNHASKDNMACVSVGAEDVRLLPVPRTRHAPDADQVEWITRRYGAAPRAQSEGSLSGFTFAFDLRGFDPDVQPQTYADVTPLEARNQNLYLYRYLLRAWPDASLFVEGGMSHGVHLKGLGRDNAAATAMLLRTDITWWDELSAPAERWQSAPLHPRRNDPNLLPEDGYARWSVTAPLEGEPSCYSH